MVLVGSFCDLLYVYVKVNIEIEKGVELLEEIVNMGDDNLENICY